MKIISKNFTHNSELPKKFSCDGEGGIPHLEWSEFPKKTRSFALVVKDPDAPMGEFIHWMIYNIPTKINFIEEGTTNLKEAAACQNHGGLTEYINPCPPSGSHRYIFTVFALGIDNLQGLTKETFESDIKPHIVDQAEIIGTYQRK